MKKISYQYGKYLDYCKQKGLLPTDYGFEKYIEAKKIIIAQR